MYRLLMAAAFLLIDCGLALATTRSDIETFQDEAMALIETRGLDAAAREFAEDARWKRGTLYIVICTFDGTMLAHTANPHAVGRNTYRIRSAGGRPFVIETIENVRRSGRSSLEMRWPNPDTRLIQDATFFARRIPGHDAYLASMLFR